MSKPCLVIVESPGKIKKLKAILGADYEIVASVTIIELRKRARLGVYNFRLDDVVFRRTD